MYILKPISKARIWGTPRLHDYSGDSEITNIGSVYSASCIDEISCTIINGKHAGERLQDIISQNPQVFGLHPEEEYPLIISLTAADENLSLQVHPTDSYIRNTEGINYGKSEAWYFIEAPIDGWIYAGHNAESKSDLSDAIAMNTIKHLVATANIKKGELAYIPSGTIHALTKGSLVYEIQQATNITYRFYDYDRKDADGNKRELHVEQALATLEFDSKIENEPFPLHATIQKREFYITHCTLSETYTNTSAIAQIITIITGSLIIDYHTVEKGQSICITPKETIQIIGEATAIIATPIPYWRDCQK